jgi:hypothetical protein
VDGAGSNLGLVIKIGFVMSILLYAGVAVGILGMPDWNAPWVPQQPPGSTLVMILPVLALGAFVAGFLLGRRPGPDGGQAPGRQPWYVTRFVFGAAATESGAILMLLLSFITKDARWAILGALPAAALLLLAPASAGEGSGLDG